MVNKYRVHEVAKDLGVNSKEVLELLAQYFEDPKKHMTALTEEELSVVFEHYSQSQQVGSIEEIEERRLQRQKDAVKKAAQKVETKPESKPQPAVEPKTQPQVVTARQPQKPAASVEKKAEEKTESKPAASVAAPAAKAPEQRPAAQQGQPAHPQGQQPQRQGASAQSQNRGQGQNRSTQPQVQNRQQGQTANQNQNRTRNQDRFDRGRVQSQERLNNSRPQNQKGNNQNRPAQNRTSVQPSRPLPPPNKTVTTVDTSGNKIVRHVDMRAATVELDKYNEKYEQIAPATAMKDNNPRKQKFSQRPQRGRPQSRRELEQEKLRKLELERQRRQKLEITIPDEISVSELALRLKVQVSEVVKKLMMAGVMASASDIIDYDTAALAAMEIGAKVEHEVVVTIEDRLIDTSEDEDNALVPRDPVVVVMGHVDHGKTSLLDAIRNADVAMGEAGGITQHIGAYRVKVGERSITFLDTPGHAAFTSMRARGAQVTDIAVLVVAADDGIMPQTIEAINHAKAAGVSIIVAINKMDKPEANPDIVKQQLTEYELVPEEWGGDTICVPVSAKAHDNIDMLLEMIQLVADMKELRANPDRKAKGTVIEARLDKGRGPVATVLIQNGTLRTGDIIIAGTAVGRVRQMLDDKGRRLKDAGPSVPVEITGLVEVPSAGDEFNAVEDEKLARQLVEERKQKQKEEMFGSYTKVTLDNLFSQIEQGDMKELAIVVKADVQGSVEAVKQSLEKLSNDEVRVRVIHGAVGAISESDVMLANASNAIIVGFNVRPDPVARDSADRDHVDIRLYRVIYDAIEEIESAMKGMLAPKYREKQLGRAEVRLVYKISNVGTVAGCYVLDGKIVRNASVRLVRDGIVLAEDKLSSLKRFKDDVKEVAQGYECGMSLEKYSDIHEGDILEAFEMEEYRD